MDEAYIRESVLYPQVLAIKGEADDIMLTFSGLALRTGCFKPGIRKVTTEGRYACVRDPARPNNRWNAGACRRDPGKARGVRSGGARSGNPGAQNNRAAIFSGDYGCFSAAKLVTTNATEEELLPTHDPLNHIAPLVTFFLRLAGCL